MKRRDFGHDECGLPCSVYAENFNKGKASVQVNGRPFLIDREGKEVDE